MDTMENHAEIRNLVDWDSRRSDLHQKGYLQRKNGRSSTEDRTYAESDLESSSFSMTDQRNHAPPAVLVYDQGLNSDDGWYGQSCPWPGCHDGYRRQRRKDIQKNAFWAPVGVTPVEIIQQGYRGYLTWRIYSEGKPEHEKAPEKARGPQTASHELGALAVDTSPWAYMHKSLSTKAVYVEHISVPSLKIAEIMTELRSAGCNELVTLGRDTTELIEHFVPSSIYPDVKGKAFGALYNILKRCQNLDRQALKKHGVVQASKQMQKMLQVSHSIRQGIFGRQDEVYILNSLVIAFERLVLWLIDFDTNMLLPRILSRPMDEDTETESDSMDNLDDALDSIMGGDPAAASDVQNPDPPGTATKSQPEKDTKGQIPQDRPQRSWKRAVGDLHDITKSLQRAKVEILRLFEEQIPLDLDAYSTVNPGGILASIVGSLAHGDSDLPLPLSRDNAHLSSIFSNSGRVSSQSVVQMNIAELYQEYCSRLRLAVREKPTRDLLDDLDLLEEELDSIIQVTESQQTVMRDFISHSWHRLPTQYDWVDDLNGSYRMLEKNISLYRDLKTQIAKLRKQVTLQIEFKQDNHGKAILVFTTMTAIFLPLSFVTSYFGMNASDIRDMAHGQWIYWAVSIPVTVCVVGFCMLVAYQGHRVQEYFR
ncbi:hypothetical protein BJX61DRAFT_415529 [Aspergillus egyptiacus]|nr:hypothetical protein BJX61DRAFT_415529 [Aspergillus egyptiacus]